MRAGGQGASLVPLAPGASLHHLIGRPVTTLAAHHTRSTLAAQWKYVWALFQKTTQFREPERDDDLRHPRLKAAAGKLLAWALESISCLHGVYTEKQSLNWTLQTGVNLCPSL